MKFSDVTNVNDIQEAEISCQISNPQQMPLMPAYSEIRQEYKQISLTMDYDSFIEGCMSPMMWGHYADKRKGVCIELEFDKLSIPEGCLMGMIKYKPLLPKYFQLDPKIKNRSQLHSLIRRKSKEVFFTKQSGWKEENEFRIISTTSEFLDISESIVSVSLTSCDSIECRLVEELVADTIPVRFLKYIYTSKNLALPVMSDTRKHRSQTLAAKNNPDNVLNNIHQQALQIYESTNGDNKASLLQEVIYLPKSK